MPDRSHDAPARRPEILSLGADGLLLRFSTRLDDEANLAVLGFAAALEEDPPGGVAEISTALSSVYLRFDPGATERAALIECLETRLRARDWYHAAPQSPQRHWHVPASFGGALGPDLTETADFLGMGEAEALADLAAHPLRVLAIGFAPGQPYMGMLPERWDIPRLTQITPSVPAGAVVVAVRQAIIFSGPAPTGWRHIGQSAFRPFRPEGRDPFPLRPGDMVHFTPVSAEEYDRIARSDSDGSGGARLEVMR